jgi:SAM-dependent methyltransferase
MDNFYEKNHQQYFDSTSTIDPSDFLTPFGNMLKPGSTIFDIGCGSGRDLLWFKEQGFSPTGFEHSPSLARLAWKYSNCPVIEGDFHSYNFSIHKFDALCFVGSLVHIPENKFSHIFELICNALKPGGLLFITMKEGRGLSHSNDGRVFTLWSKKNLEIIFNETGLQVLEFKRQVSKLRQEDTWLGFILRLDDFYDEL